MRKKKLTNKILAWSALALLVILLGVIAGLRITVGPERIDSTHFELHID